MVGSLNMNGWLLYGLPTDSRPVYRGDEAVSWAQLTSHIQNVLRPHTIRNKTVISVTAYPVITNSIANYWGFYGGQGRDVDGYKTLTTGRIIKIIVHTSSHEVISTRVRILGGPTQQHVFIKRNAHTLSQNTSMDFQIGSAISLTVMEGGSHIIMNDRVTLLLELDI